MIAAFDGDDGMRPVELVILGDDVGAVNLWKPGPNWRIRRSMSSCRTWTTGR